MSPSPLPHLGRALKPISWFSDIENVLKTAHTAIPRGRIAAATVAAALASCLATYPRSAHADVQAIMRINNPLIDARIANLSPGRRAIVERLMTMSTYATRTKTRTDTGNVAAITDLDARKVIMVCQDTYTYYVATYDDISASGLVSPGAVSIPHGAHISDFHITRTGTTQSILGHICQEYVVTGTMRLPGVSQTLTMSDAIFVARDVPHAPVAPVFGAFSSLSAKLPGFPLRSALTLSSGGRVVTSATTDTVSLSTAPVPAYVFQVPAGYARIPNREAFMAQAMRSLMASQP